MKFKKEFDNLSKEQKGNILKQYELEVLYADIIRQSSDPLERGKLYYKLYNDFFKQLPNHPLVLRSKNKRALEHRINRTIQFLHPYINASTKFIEIGAGDCNLAVRLSNYVEKIVAVDVSEEIMPDYNNTPENVKLHISNDGTSLPSETNYFNVAYSNQLLEHFHPEDVKKHLSNVNKVLCINGCYLFQTPHKYFGPHDVSVYFHNKPIGFHLKEYCNYELYFLLREAGFRKINLITGIKKHRILLPIIIPSLVEFLLALFPFQIRKYLSLLTPIRKCINGHIIAIK